jgi:cytochrome b6-f complex iron-sulfur subunit
MDGNALKTSPLRGAEPISRRCFLIEMASGAAVAIAGVPLLARGAPPAAMPTPDMPTISLNDKAYAALKTVGKGVYLPVDLQENPLIVWRQTETSVRAFSSTCAHQGCKVRLPAKGEIKCPCHGSVYGEDGRPTHGPAKEPLKEFAAQLKDDKITIDMRAPIS